MASSAHNSHTGAFSYDRHCSSICSQSALFLLLVSSYRIIKSYVFKDWDLIKSVIFTYSLKNF